MFKAVVLALAVVAVSAELDLTAPVHSDAIINAVNSNPAATWTAGVNAKFVNATLADAKLLMGVNTPLEQRMKLPRAVIDQADIDAAPSDYDCRTKFPNCPLIGKARDQSACGSCWAFGSTEAFNDRMCISSKGAFQTELSAADTASCCSGFACGFSMGCGGGQPTAAWSWFTKVGVVSGGGYPTIGEGKTCLPYPFEVCAHHVTEPKVPDCPSQEYNMPACSKTCSESSYGTPYAKDKHFAKSAYSLGSVEEIQADIVKNGPVTAAFSVYADFLTYKSGVYKHVSGDYLGGHAVKIVGYGVDPTAGQYWTVMNSWNQGWGDNGSFKIAVDSCGISSDVSAGLTA